MSPLIPLLACATLFAGPIAAQEPDAGAAQEQEAETGEAPQIPAAEQEAWEAFAPLQARLDAGPEAPGAEAARAFHRAAADDLVAFARGEHAATHVAAYALWIAAVLREGLDPDPSAALDLYERAFAIARRDAPPLPEGLLARGYVAAGVEEFLHAALLRAGRFARAEILARELLAAAEASDDAERRAILRARLREIARERLLQPGSPLPDFSGAALGGGEARLLDYRGRVTLVDVWASWAPPCRASLREVHATWSAWHDAGFAVLGISLDRARADAVAFLEEHEAPWTHVLDGGGWDGPLARALHVRSLPANFLLDEQGRIVARNLRGAGLEQAVAELLSDGDAPAQDGDAD